MQRFAFVAAAAVAAFSAAALASPASVRVMGNAPNGSSGYAVRAMTVQYDDSELATSQGAAALFARVSQAAESVCTVRPVRFGTADQVARCKRDAISRAVETVNAPAFTQAAGAN